MNFGFIIDNRKCIGCHACTVACKAEHETPLGVNRTWVKYIEKGEFPNTRRHFSVMRCNHCDDAPCIDICPVTALFRRSDGIVDFDKDRCIGCKACTQACPYNALYIDPDTHTAAKCNYCAHRIDVGLEPACVNVCPEHAIISGDMDDPGSEISQLLAREQVVVRRPEKGTQPKLFYIEGDEASIEPTMTPESMDYMWSSQATGVGHYAKYAERKTRRAKPEELILELASSHPKERLASSGNGGSREPVAAAARKKRWQGGVGVLKESARRVYDAPTKGVLWGWEVSAYLWTKSIAAGAFLVPFTAHYVLGGSLSAGANWLALIFSLLFLALTGLLLVKDLDRPDRFLYVLLRPQWKSWLVRGAYVLSLYGLFLVLLVAARLLNLSALINPLVWGGLAFAFLTAIYTAFLFAQAKGRDFWQGPLFAFHLLAHAWMAGASVFLLVGLFATEAGLNAAPLRLILIGSLVFHLLSVSIELMTPHATEDGRRAADSIIRGQFSSMFWIGVILLGNLLPLVLAWAGGVGVLALAGLFTLVGIYCAEYIWVRAPQLIPMS